MRRLMILTVMLALLFALVMASPRAPRVVKADELCDACMSSAQQRFDMCVAVTMNNMACYDQFNRDMVVCYARFCEL
jgi:hypothetical protein